MKHNILHKDYFKVINTPEKAYFLGFLYADGCVHYNKNGKHKVLSLAIQQKDGYICEKLSSAIYGKSIVYTRQRNPKWQPICSTYISSVDLVDDLIDKGCIPRKSFTMRFPKEDKLPLNFISHFIRGHFDGDGSVSIKSTDNKCKIEITSNINFCNDLKDILMKYFGISSHLYLRKRGGNRKPIGSLQIFKIRDIKLFIDTIYKDSTIHLFRKKEKFDFFLKNLDNRYLEEIEIFYPCGKVDKTNDILTYAKERKLKASLLLRVADGILKSSYGLKAKYSKDLDFRYKEKCALKYKIITPENKLIKITNLKKFCSENNLSYSTMMDHYRGKLSDCRGYKCMPINSEIIKYVDRRQQRKSNISKALEKKYIIFFKDGTHKEIVNLKKFCKENKYSLGTIYQVKNGKRKYHKNIIGINKI